MILSLTRLPFLLELLVNGTYILFYSLKLTNKIPHLWDKHLVEAGLQWGAWVIPFIVFFVLVANYLQCESIEQFLRKHVFSLIVFIPLVITWGDLEFTFWLSSVHLFSSILGLYDSELAGKDVSSDPTVTENGAIPFIEKLHLSPAQIVAWTFFLLIMAGTFLLMLPVSARKGMPNVPFIDALFVTTSAACVTGLSTISIHDNLSLFGQLVVLVVIQVGGLGIMTLSSSLALLLGKSMGLKDRILLQDLLDASTTEELFDLIIDIIRYTFIIELWGGIILTVGFTFDGFELGKAIYYGFYHAISAFCNAGFSLFNNNLESFANSPLIHGTIAVLITLGGLGFIVLRDLKMVFAGEKGWRKLHMHSKVVLLVSATLTFGGAIFIFFSEFLNVLDGYGLWEKIQIALFQSVTLRTAGFNSIPLGNLHNYTAYVMIILMFIGASPGSTGGGIKTSTLAILIQSIRSTLRGRNSVEIMGRKLSPQLVVRATALTMLSLMIVAFFLCLLLMFEQKQSFLTLFFETVSAFGTVGLSLGVTPYLTFMGKLIISIVMYIGRIGPLTLMLAVGQQRESSGKYDYPEGRIMIG